MDNSRFKFRVWNTETNKMITNVKEMGVFALQSIYTIDEFLVIPTNEKYPLMQYTGLKDKNGVEIYEGDIIKYDFNELNYRIEFLNAEFIARRFYENIENLYPTEFDYGKECEVIGNIYENKELLN